MAQEPKRKAYQRPPAVFYGRSVSDALTEVVKMLRSPVSDTTPPSSTLTQEVLFTVGHINMIYDESRMVWCAYVYEVEYGKGYGM